MENSNVCYVFVVHWVLIDYDRARSSTSGILGVYTKETDAEHACKQFNIEKEKYFYDNDNFSQYAEISKCEITK